MKSLTIEDIMSFRPCSKYTVERVTKLWAGRESLTPLEILDLDIPIRDRLWAALRLEVIGERLNYQLVADFSERVLPLFENAYPSDNRVRVCIKTTRRFVAGEATLEELTATRSATRSAAQDATCDAGTLDTAYVAARSAIRDEAYDAACDAIYAAQDAGEIEMAWQLEHVKNVMIAALRGSRSI